ncbi:MAG TPA: RpiB/LacA/LacB family sugar-phosphate isomerase [Jatrophihabitans sp.]|jgi:ribose 5-phosphate isomerase B|nr:RpiB/LacA/LacB family sugar-phosphate isomerase [Jatrophihabitans sp.]
MRIAIAADHNGIELKRRLMDRLLAGGHQVDDLGSHSADEVVDYPLLCAGLGRQVVGGEADRAVMIGGSGSGELIACNKIRGVRAGLALEPFTTEISRAHNDANMLVIGAKVLSPEQAEELLELWLRTPFKGGRHQQRLEQIAALERGEPL